jgi:hypothetical protein
MAVSPRANTHLEVERNGDGGGGPLSPPRAAQAAVVVAAVGAADPGRSRSGERPARTADLGFGRIIASEIEAPNMLAVPV